MQFKVISLVSLFFLVSCGGAGSSSDSDSSTSTTLTTLKSFRASLSDLSAIAPASKFNPKAGDDATDWTDSGTYTYGDETGLSLKDWFRNELDNSRDMTGSGDNFFNRLDIALVWMCAIFEDLGDDLEDQTTTITADASSINANCGTNLPDVNFSITGQSAVVTSLTGAAYEKKVVVDGMELFITNSASELKVAYGSFESSESSGERIVYSLDKSTSNFQLEFMQYEGSGSDTIYRAFKSEGIIYIVGRSPQGSSADYYAVLNGSKAAVDFNINNGTEKSLCVNLSTGDKESSGYGSCMAQSSAIGLSDFASIINYNLAANIETWTAVNSATTIDFTAATDMDGTSF